MPLFTPKSGSARTPRRSCSLCDPSFIVVAFFISELAALSGLFLDHLLFALAGAYYKEKWQSLPRFDRNEQATESGKYRHPSFSDFLGNLSVTIVVEASPKGRASPREASL